MPDMLIYGTIIDYLDAHAGAFTATLTAALVLVTIYYAAQNYRMVTEMRRTRELAILPKLALEFQPLAPMVLAIAIKNVGPGAALDVDVVVTYVPRGASSSMIERRWRANTLVPGEQHDFFPPGELGDNLTTIPEAFQEIRLRGSMRDASGREYAVSDCLEDLREWRDLLTAVRRRWVADREERLGKEIGDALGTRLGELANSLSQIATAVRER